MGFQRTLFARCVATSLAVALLGWTGSIAGAPVVVSGTVFDGSDKQPLVGATIHLGSIADGRLLSSAKTAADGRFELQVPAGATYEVGVEHDGRLFLVAEPVTPADGQPLVLNLAVQPSRKPLAARSLEGAAGLGATPLATTLMVVGSALAVGAVVESASNDEDDDPVASEFLAR